jgi:hypothetical protein
MGQREYALQRIYDKIETENHQEAAMDSKLLADNKSLADRMKRR